MYHFTGTVVMTWNERIFRDGVDVCMANGGDLLRGDTCEHKVEMLYNL